MNKHDDVLDSAVLSAGFFRRINGGDMSINPMMNSLSSQGVIGNAQNSLLGQGVISNSPLGSGGIASQSQAAWNAALTAKTAEKSKPRVELSLHIFQAENGFVLNMANQYGGMADTHIAATLEDICTIITSQLASRMLDRTE